MFYMSCDDMRQCLKIQSLGCAVTVFAALLFSSAASSQSVEYEKLRLLSCITSVAGSQSTKERESQADAARNWLNRLPQDDFTGALLLLGRHELEGVCLQDVSVVAGFGALIVSGKICNKSVDQLRSSLASLGVNLIPNSGTKPADPILQTENKQGGKRLQYAVFKGTITLEGGISVEPRSDVLSYLCSAQAGGTQ
jgi:hypothetical protein